MRIFPSLVLTALLTQSACAQPAPSELFTRVSDMWQAGDLESAQQLLQPLLKADRKNPEVLALLGQTMALMGNLDDAEDMLEQAVDKAPNHPDYQHWYGTVNCSAASSASMFSALGYAKRCKKAFLAALELAPDNARNYIALGQFYAQAPSVAGGDKNEARALAHRLKDIDLLQGLLLELSVTEFSDDSAFEQFVAQSEQLKVRPEPYFTRAMQLSESKNYSDSIALLRTAMAQPISDDDAKETVLESHYQLARLAVVSETSVEEGIAAMQYYLENSADPRRKEWAGVRLAQLYSLANAPEQAKNIATPLLSTTDNSDIKKILKRLLSAK